MRRVLGLAAVVVLGLTASALAADATGTWKWTIERNGQTRDVTLKLKQEGAKLTGTISGRDNTEIPIEEGKVEGDDVSFRVVREFNGNRFVQEYRGKLGADAIKGTIEFERNGEKQSRDWEAKKG
jgi:hypothetical protein